MHTTVFSGAIVGIEGLVVEVEVDIARGIPAFSVVGLPNAVVSGIAMAGNASVKKWVKKCAGHVMRRMRCSSGLNSLMRRKSFIWAARTEDQRSLRRVSSASRILWQHHHTRQSFHPQPSGPNHIIFFS